MRSRSPFTRAVRLRGGHRLVRLVPHLHRSGDYPVRAPAVGVPDDEPVRPRPRTGHQRPGRRRHDLGGQWAPRLHQRRARPLQPARIVWTPHPGIHRRGWIRYLVGAGRPHGRRSALRHPQGPTAVGGPDPTRPTRAAHRHHRPFAFSIVPLAAGLGGAVRELDGHSVRPDTFPPAHGRAHAPRLRQCSETSTRPRGTIMSSSTALMTRRRHADDTAHQGIARGLAECS